MTAWMMVVIMKRLFLKPGFYLSVAISLALMAVLYLSVFPASDNRQIGLYSEEGSEAGEKACEILASRDGGGLYYVRYDSVGDLKAAVRSGVCDSGFDLSGLPEIARVFVSQSSTKAELAKEGIYSAAFYDIAGDRSGDREMYDRWLSSDELFDADIYGAVSGEGLPDRAPTGIGSAPSVSRALASVLPVIIAFSLLSCSGAYGKDMKNLSAKAGTGRARLMVFLQSAAASLTLSAMAVILFMKGETADEVLLVMFSGIALSALGSLFTLVFGSVTSYMGFASAVSLSACALILVCG